MDKEQLYQNFISGNLDGIPIDRQILETLYSNFRGQLGGGGCSKCKMRRVVSSFRGIFMQALDQYPPIED